MPPIDDENTVEHLRKFQPRPARALNLRRRRMSVGKRLAVALAAAALLVIAFITFRPTPMHVGTPVKQATSGTKPPAITVMQLNAAMREEGDLDATLARSAREVLPATNRPNTALNALSKE